MDRHTALQAAIKLKNKKIALAVTAGIEGWRTMANGRYKFTCMQEVLRPFEITIKYVGAEYVPAFAFLWCRTCLTLQEVIKSAVDYVKYLTRINLR